jgi:sodium/proline symporter
MHFQLVIAFVLYLVSIFCIGLVASRRNRATTVPMGHDFILGGRSTHWFLTALSAHAADMSDWLFMGLPAAVYLAGGTEIWIPIGLIVGMFCSWHFVARTLRITTEQYQALTLASYFKKRFQDDSGRIAAVAALLSFFFFTLYVSVGLKGIGYVLKSAFDIEYHLGILIALAVILSYVLLGGFTSVAWLDMFQGIFLLIMLMFVPVYAYYTVGGINVILDAAALKGISLSLFPDHSFRGLCAIIFNPFSWCLGYFGMPHILTKFMGTANPEEINKAKYLGLAWQLLALSSAVAVGLVGIAYFQMGVPGKTEFIFIEMAKGLFSPFVAGFVLCAILAATISTIDSQLLVLAGIVAEDFYKNIFRPQASVAAVYRVYNYALLSGAAVSLFFAWNEQSSIMTLVKYAWSGLGASYGPLVLLSLYSNYPNKYGALAGILTGATVSITWDWINPYITDITVYSMAPAFLCSIIAIYVVSYFTSDLKH